MVIRSRPAIRRRLLLGCVLVTALALALLAVTADRTLDAATMQRFFGLWRARHALAGGGLLVVAGVLGAAALSRRAFLAFLTAGLGVAVTIGALDLVGMARVVTWSDLFTGRQAALGRRAVPHLDVSGTTFQDTAAVWGMPSDPIPFRYRTDRYGFRNDGDRAGADVYLLGDSMLVAALIPFDATVVARLEKTLRRPVMQLALIGIGPQEEQDLFRTAGLEARGRLVIQFVYEANDLLDSMRVRRPPPRGATALWNRTLTYQLVRNLQNLTRPAPSGATSQVCTIEGQTYTFLWIRDSFAGVEGEATAISDALSGFAAEIRQAGGEFAVVFIPSKLRVLGPLCRFPPGSDLSEYTSHLSPLREHLRAWSGRSGVDLLDLTEPLRAAARAGRIPWLWGDTHWNEEGHAVASGEISAWAPVAKRRQAP
jgi:hypothetical protein